MEPKGIGALQKAFEDLKARLEREGLFDRDRKRPLPVLPGRMHLVQSRFATLREGRPRELVFADLKKTDDPSRINDIESEIQKVTPELLQRTAQGYLRPTNQTVLTVKPTKTLSKEEQQHEN